MARHNELQDRVADISRKPFTTSHMRNDLLIFAGCAVKRSKVNPSMTTDTTVLDSVPPPESMEQKGDLLIRDLWHNRTNSVHNMRFVNTYANVTL